MTVTTKQRIAVDVGSGFTQFTNGRTDGHFPSIVAPMPKKLGFGAQNVTNIVSIDGKTFLVGQDAYSHGDPGARLETLSDDWAGSLGWQALFYSAVAQGIRDPEEPVSIVTGLPQRLYTDRKDDLFKFLHSDHEFGFAGKEFKIRIKPKVIPQASGALFAEAQKNPRLMAEDVGVIDIGTFTTGLSVMENQNYTAHKCGGCSVGMSQLLREFKNWLSREKGFAIDEAKLPKILMEKKFRFRNETFEVGKEINQMAVSVAKPMLEIIDSKWNGAGDLLVYVAGGGGPYFIEAIKAVVPHAQLMENPFLAVVKGMFHYLEKVDA